MLLICLKKSYRYCEPCTNLSFAARIYRNSVKNLSPPDAMCRIYLVLKGHSSSEASACIPPQSLEFNGNDFVNNYFLDFEYSTVAPKKCGNYLLVVDLYEKIPGSVEYKKVSTIKDEISIINYGQVPLPYKDSYNRSLHCYPGILLEVTNICNMNCDFCPSRRMTRSKGKMPIERANDILRDVFSYSKMGGIGWHILGEPLLHKEFVQMVDIVCGKYNSRSVVTTNGTLISEEFFKSIYMHRTLEVLISLQTFDEGNHFSGSKLTRELHHQKVADILHLHYKLKSTATIRLSYLINTSRKGNGGIQNFAKVRAVLTYWLSIAKKIASVSINKQKNVSIDTPKDLEPYFYPKPGFEIMPNVYIVFKRDIMSWNWDIDTRIINMNTPEKMPCPKHRHAPCITWDSKFVMCCWDYDAKTIVANYETERFVEILEKYDRLLDQFIYEKPPFVFCSHCINRLL